MNLRAIVVAAVLAGALAPAGQAPAPAPRSLAPTIPIHDALTAGERATFTFDVPANTAAHVVVQQEGVDVALILRPRGGALPAHSLDFAGGTAGQEQLFPPVSDTAASWEVVVRAALPHAVRGEYTITLELAPADDTARAVAAARDLHYRTLAPPPGVEDGAALMHERDSYAAAAAAALEAGDVEQAAESTYQAARRADSLGDTMASITGERTALDLFQRVGRHDREGRVLNRLGDLSRKIGEVGDAERCFAEALPLVRAAHDAEANADVLNNSALLLLAMGRYDEAVERLQAAIPLAREINSANVEGAALHNVAEAYYNLGDYDHAVEYFQRAGEVLRPLRLPRRVGRAQQGLAEAYYARGDRAEADATMKSAIALFEQAEDRAYLAEGLAAYGLMRHADGDNDAAIDLFSRALPMLRENRNGRAQSRVLTGWAEAELERGDATAALAKVDEAVRFARDVASPANEARALYVRARALDRLNRLADAAVSIDGAVQVVEKTRGELRRSELRTSYLAAVASYYDFYVDVLQRQGRTAAAFEISERSRARTLLEGLAQAAAKIDKGVDPAMLARRRALQARIDAKESYRGQLALQPGKEAQGTAAARDIAVLREQLATVDRALEAASPSYMALLEPQPVDAARVQRHLLDAATTLVEYHVGLEHSYAWIVDRGTISAVTLPKGGVLDDLARRYHQALSRDFDAMSAAERQRASAGVTALGRRVAAAIWAPVAPRVRGTRVLVVADGALQYVPFAALPDGGAPLVLRREIVYLPSASVLDTLRRDSHPIAAGVSAAVFADPVFSKDDPRFAAARDTATPAHTRASAGVRYGRLRFSRREAEAIAAVAPGAFQALDFSAAKSTLLGSHLRNYQILHFATHGSLDALHPERSGLVFSLVDKAGKPVDGFLRLDEIYNLDLSADLVVLSACQTALGKEVHGEGLIGLTRGFMYAGASRVVSSVWNVDDRASAELMKRFYAAMLVRKLAPAAALREAQLSLYHDPRWANPHYWAAFGSYGEPN